MLNLVKIGVEKGRIYLRFNGSVTYYDATAKAAKELGRAMNKQGIKEWLYSSTFDFPKQEGAKRNVDLRTPLEAGWAAEEKIRLNKKIEEISKEHDVPVETIKAILKTFTEEIS